MVRVKVVVVPVALVPAPDDQFRVMAFVPGGSFLSATASGTGEVTERGADLLAQACAEMGASAKPRMEEVAFLPEGDALQLIYTAVLPLLAWDERVASHDAAPEGWVLLTPWVGRGNTRKREALPEPQGLVRNYWRRQFEETSAVLDFLPKYFTTAQARAAYSSLWGEQQHEGAFHRWLHDRDPAAKTPLVTPVEERVVRRDAEETFERLLEKSALGLQIGASLAGGRAATGTLTKVAGPSVGLSGAAVAASALGFLPAAVVAGGIAGSIIAYQRKVTRGKKPLWYTRARQQRILIDDPYAPRPRWLTTGGNPGRFH